MGAWQSALPQLLARRYHVLGPVGRGAIAEVVRAHDEHTGGEVALKILYPHLRESREVVERFRREVDIVRRIQHPHVLAIHDVVDSDGQLFLVMNYHPGGDLADRLARKRRLETAELRVLAGQVCGALAAAHRAGVVHRDVKPSNVLCGPATQLDVRLCDFGLARTGELVGLTTANAVLGTPEYMAPEVVADGHADPRSDIYSLGVMLFEAATGKLPFYGDSPYQLMRQHLDVEAPRALSLAPNLPKAVDAAIARALAKDPLDRFATVDDLARALSEDAGAASVALMPTPPATPARRVCRRCGGWVVDLAATCADCGATMLRLDYQRGGVSVLVTGPGEPADKLDAWRQVALYELVDELPAGSVRLARRRRAPRVPFYVAKRLSTASAERLIDRLGGIGLEAKIETGGIFRPKAVRKKFWRMVFRYGAAVGVFGALQGVVRLIPHGWFWFLPFAVAGSGAAVLAVSAVQSGRSLVRQVSDEHRRDANKRLAARLRDIDGRQDRRLVARILDRLALVRGDEHENIAQALAERADAVAAALVASDVRRREHASVSGSASGALEELRREEVLRVVLRGALLRVASRLDGFSVALARAAAASSHDDARQLEDGIRELEIAIEADAEIAMLLGAPK